MTRVIVDTYLKNLMASLRGKVPGDMSRLMSFIYNYYIRHVYMCGQVHEPFLWSNTLGSMPASSRISMISLRPNEEWHMSEMRFLSLLAYLTKFAINVRQFISLLY